MSSTNPFALGSFRTALKLPELFHFSKRATNISWTIIGPYLSIQSFLKYLKWLFLTNSINMLPIKISFLPVSTVSENYIPWILRHLIWLIEFFSILIKENCHYLYYCSVYGAFELGLAVSVPLPIVTGIFVLLWFQSRLT